MDEPCAELDKLAHQVIGAALVVHKTFGPGLLESVYEAALAIELQLLGMEARRQVLIPALYRGHDLGLGFRADMIVNDSLLIELKTVENLTPLHVAQTLSYLKLTGCELGLLINFNSSVLKSGIRRIINSPSP